MARLIYTAITSLDGYVADENGDIDVLAPDEEVHAYINDLERGIGTYLYGRRLYQVMAVWETWDTGQSPVSDDYASIWRAADKIVFSRSLDTVSTPRTRLEREFDPDVVRGWKESSPHDLTVGGPELAAIALRAGLVDELHLFVSPVVVGGGAPALPDHVQLGLELVDERRFARGVVHLHYSLQ
jgi:dihydrofolate reductase